MVKAAPSTAPMTKGADARFAKATKLIKWSFRAELANDSITKPGPDGTAIRSAASSDPSSIAAAFDTSEKSSCLLSRREVDRRETGSSGAVLAVRASCWTAVQGGRSLAALKGAAWLGAARCVVGGLPPPKKTEARAMRPRAASRHLLPILIGRVRGGSAPGLPSTGL
eukprot:scaffold167698_cov31-Tisochrysis_lutea.AAC.1